MPVGRLLVLMRDVEQLRFSKVIADDLQADRAFGNILTQNKTARGRQSRQASHAGRER